MRFKLTGRRRSPLMKTPIISPFLLTALYEQLSLRDFIEYCSSSAHSPRLRNVLRGSSCKNNNYASSKTSFTETRLNIFVNRKLSQSCAREQVIIYEIGI